MGAPKPLSVHIGPFSKCGSAKPPLKLKAPASTSQSFPWAEYLPHLEKEIESTQEHLSDLKAQADSIRTLLGHVNPPSQLTLRCSSSPSSSVPSPSSSLKDCGIKQAAFQILKDRPPDEWVPYREISAEAFRRGYEHANDTTLERMQLAFFSSMRQRRDVFEFRSPGRFRLASSVRDHNEIPPKVSRPRKRQTDTLTKIRECISRIGACSPSAIRDETGISAGTISNYMRIEYLKKLDRGLWDLLDDDPLRDENRNGKDVHHEAK